MNGKFNAFPDIIGYAFIESDSTIAMTLRAKGPAGLLGDMHIIVRPDDKNYQATIEHLGPMRSGEHKPVKA